MSVVRSIRYEYCIIVYSSCNPSNEVRYCAIHYFLIEKSNEKIIFTTFMWAYGMSIHVANNTYVIDKLEDGLIQISNDNTIPDLIVTIDLFWLLKRRNPNINISTSIFLNNKSILVLTIRISPDNYCTSTRLCTIL